MYLKVKVKEGQLENFLQKAAYVVGTLKSTEPEALQFEAFSNNETSEVVWLQSHREASSLDLH